VDVDQLKGVVVQYLEQEGKKERMTESIRGEKILIRGRDNERLARAMCQHSKQKKEKGPILYTSPGKREQKRKEGYLSLDVASMVPRIAIDRASEKSGEKETKIIIR